MEILMLILTEIILGYLLQSTSCILWLNVFSSNKINKKQFILLSLAFTAIMYVVRLLPIRFGIHTLLSIIAIVLIGIWIYKFNVYRSAIIGFAATVTILISEIITYYALKNIIGEVKLDALIKAEDYTQFIPGDIASVVNFLIVLSMFAITRRINKNKIKELN